MTLWEALCGRRPYGAASVEALLLRLESGEPDPLPADVKLPSWLRRVLLRERHASDGATRKHQPRSRGTTT